MSNPSPQPPRPPHQGIIAWFAYNPVAANFLMLGLIVAGLISAFTIRKEFFPSVELDTIRIQVPYLGAAPQEVEEGVIIKIEEAIQDLEGIKEITATAAEGMGTVNVEVETGFDSSRLVDRIKNRVDGISTFPEETEEPIIFERTLRREVLWVQISGPMSERDLKEFGRDIRDEIVDLPEVSQADLRGARDYEVAIEVTEEDLRQYQLTFDDVVRAVRGSSLDLPAGSIKTEGGEVLLRTKGQAYTGDDFARLVLLTNPDGTRLTLGDVATITDGFAEVDTLVRFNDQPSVGVQVFRVGDESTLAISKAVRAYVEEKRLELPEGLDLTVWGDSALLLEDRVNLMVKNAALGAFLVFLSLTLFLRLQLALWVMLGLPVCFLGTIWLMTLGPVDISINMITLFGFILVLGIVVDDAIVIGENVYTNTRQKGQNLYNVVEGARAVAMPATFGVLTTVAAFMPMLFIPGVNGKIWSQIALVVIFCLLFSLVESKLILPAHLSHLSGKSRNRDKHHAFARLQRAIAGGLEQFVAKVYQPFLDRCLHARYTTVAAFIAIFILSIGLVGGGLIRFVFFPNIPLDVIMVNLRMNEGTPARVTQTAAARLEETLHEVHAELLGDNGNRAAIENVLVLSFSETAAEIIVDLTPPEERDLGTMQIINAWREAVGTIPGARELSFMGSTGNSGAPIDLQLVGEDPEVLDAAADELKDHLATYGGVFDITDSFSTGKQEIRLDIRPSAEALGITLADLARQVRQGFYGAEAQRIQRDKDEVRVMIRYPREQRASIGHLENMRIRTTGGDEVPFAAVATAELDRGYATIRRVDRKRVVNVTADVDKSRVEPGEVLAQVQEEFMPGLLERYPGVGYTTEGESREQGESLGSMARNGLLALLVIYAMMAVPLKSYFKPMIIMSVIPFGVVGAILGHLIMGLPISILSLCGIIALSGVVVNDSLVLVDRVNKLEADGHPKHDAVRLAGGMRFRAILLTSLTTFLGLFPMLLERSLQAQFLIPMATSLAFGILFATVITLLLVPSLYLITEDIGRGLAATFRFLTGRPQPRRAEGEGATQPAPSAATGGS